MKLFLMSLLSIPLLFATASTQQISIDLQLLFPNARIFYIGDLDPTSLGNAPNYYSLTITNHLALIENVKIVLKVITNGQEIVHAESDEFDLPRRDAPFYFSSSDLNTGMAMIDNQSIMINNYDINFSRISNLENRVSSTGKLPAGVYQFLAELHYANNVLEDYDLSNNELTITNPTTIEPLYPGERVSNTVLTEIPTTFPYFYWQSDVSQFNLYVYRKYEDKSIQDVLSRDPILHLERYPNNLFQYPAESDPLFFYDEAGNLVGQSVGAVRPLEPGNTYYWYVEAIIPTNSGETILPSDVYQFKIAELAGAQADVDMILRYLRQILGDKYDLYMSKLQGYDPDGNILLNGVPVQVETLMRLATQIQDKQAEIKNVVVQ